MSSALARLRGLLEVEGGLLAGELVDGNDAAGLGANAAAGPRAAADPAGYELLFEAIYEGYLLHYGTGRVLRPADPDVALLAGDRLYALGLERLVALGDIAAVVELADVISLCALANARDRDDLARALWPGAARAVGWGASEAHQRAKRALGDTRPQG